MNQSQPPTLSTDKGAVGYPQHHVEYNINIPHRGNEANYYGSTQEAPRLSWFRDTQKNKPQSSSMIPATFIFLANGMNWASSIGFGPFVIGSHIQVCWFVGVIIGACISAALMHTIQKRILIIVASVLVTLNGFLIIFCIDNLTSTTFARYFDGIAFGLTLIPTIVAGSEQSVRRFRGMLLSVEQISLLAGAVVYLTFQQTVRLNPNKWSGSCSVLFGATAFVVALTPLTIESPVFWLRKNNENEALNVLRRLQKPFTVTNETYGLLNESKALLEEDLTRGSSINYSNSWIPMAKMILFRCFVTMSSFLPMTFVLITAVVWYNISILFIGSSNFTVYYILMRLFGTMLSMYFVDTVGRRIPSSIALLVGGVMLIIIAYLLNVIDRDNALAVLMLVIFYQFVAGFTAPMSTCYLSEAFSVSVKPYCILAVIFCENILQIIISCCAMTNLSMVTFCYTLGALQIGYGVIFYFIMPETKQTTLCNALKMFQQILVK